MRRGRDVHVGLPHRDALPVRPLREVARGARRGRAGDLPGRRSGPAAAQRARGASPATTRRSGAAPGEDFLGLKTLRDGEDPRDVHWRKTPRSASSSPASARERRGPNVTHHARRRTSPSDGGDDWDHAFERRIRDVASRAVAHLKRGDAVAVRTSAEPVARADRNAGADPILRFLALLESAPASSRTPSPGAGAHGQVRPRRWPDALRARPPRDDRRPGRAGRARGRQHRHARASGPPWRSSSGSALALAVPESVAVQDRSSVTPRRRA